MACNLKLPVCPPDACRVITGNCTAEPTTPACPGVPMTGANAKPWVNCKDGNTGATCKADCKHGYDGAAAATCGASGWAVVSTCVKKPDQVVCKGSPKKIENAKPFNSCSNGKLDDTCTAECADGFDGTVDATCQEDGTWSVYCDCTETPAKVTCPGAPVDKPQCEPWLNHAKTKGNVCEDGKPDDVCESACVAPGDTDAGVAEAICTPKGWKYNIDCSIQNRAARKKRMAGKSSTN